MPIFRLATRRVTRNPVRVQQWNASIRCGDDLKIALTVYVDDSGAIANVLGSRSQFALWPDGRRGFMHSPDYGLGWFTGATYSGFPSQAIAGFTTPVRNGGINFVLPSAITSNLVFGRYRLNIQLDLVDGEYCQLEGILQVRERWERPGIGHVPFALSTILAMVPPPTLVSGQPVDADGFFLATIDDLIGPISSDFDGDFTQDFNIHAQP